MTSKTNTVPASTSVDVAPVSKSVATSGNGKTKRENEFKDENNSNHEKKQKTANEAQTELDKQIAAHLKEQKKCTQLLVLDVHVDPRGVLMEAAKATTIVVSYDSKQYSCVDLAELIAVARELNDGAPFETVALATHGGEVWELAYDLVVRMGGDGNLPKALEAVKPIMDMLVTCVTKEKGGRIDLLGCSLVAYEPDLVKGLEEHYNVNFAASDDETGNLVAGGDWMLESDGIDIADTYWDRKELSKYKETMWGFNIMGALDFIPIVGGIARTVEAGGHALAGNTEYAKEAISNAGMNFVGDALGLVTGGAGKVGMIAAKTGAKALVKQGVKAGGKAFLKVVRKNVTAEAAKKYILKEFGKKAIKKKSKEAVKDLIKDGVKEIVRENLENALAEATGIDVSELKEYADDRLMIIAENVVALS